MTSICLKIGYDFLNSSPLCVDEAECDAAITNTRRNSLRSIISRSLLLQPSKGFFSCEDGILTHFLKYLNILVSVMDRLNTSCSDFDKKLPGYDIKKGIQFNPEATGSR